MAKVHFVQKKLCVALKVKLFVPRECRVWNAIAAAIMMKHTQHKS